MDRAEDSDEYIIDDNDVNDDGAADALAAMKQRVNSILMDVQIDEINKKLSNWLFQSLAAVILKNFK